MDHFELQPPEKDLPELAEQYWRKAGDKGRSFEKAAFEAGASIRNRVFSLDNLEAIVRWKSERVVHHLDKNSQEEIEKALAVAVSPDASTQDAVKALIELRGVGVPVASAILTAIFPERYTVLDFRALESLGYAQQDVAFYVEYLAFCKQLADRGIVKPQDNLPAPTALRALDRALWQWSKNGSESHAE
jgi:hypothetical protein